MAKKRLVKYTSKDFDTIKQDLVDHAKIYYPENYNDFSESSFGSMMLDAVAYVGDIMSFYLDYQVNESFLETAIDPTNIRRIAKQYGYKYFGTPAAFGTITAYVIVPAATTGLGPNLNYVPVMRTGARLQSTDGNIFMLTEDIDFSNVKNEVVAARFDNTTGKPTHYAIRAPGQVRSGDFFFEEITIGSFERNLKLRIGDSDINSVTSVIDSEGHEYYEVDNLSQDVVYREVVNSSARADGVRSLLKPFKAKRRFTVDQDSAGTYLQFGFGSDEENTVDDVADPASVALQMSGKNYISDSAFDPNKLLNTNKMGISPSNTNLRIVYGKNENSVVWVGTGQLSSVVDSNLEFVNESLLTDSLKQSVVDSIEVYNEQPISSVSAAPSMEEVRLKAYGIYSSQNRAVTKNDYEASVYLMPKKFGAVKRAAIVNDPSSSNRRLSLYIISEDGSGNLQTTNDAVKNNIKVWLNKNKMLNDSVDMYDATIVNIGMKYTITVDPEYDRFSVLANANEKIKENLLNHKMFIGEPLYISKIYSILNNVDGVIDTKKVSFNIKNGTKYSSARVNIQDLYSEDGSYLKTPKNVVLEIKYPDDDIRGAVQ